MWVIRLKNSQDSLLFTDASSRRIAGFGGGLEGSEEDGVFLKFPFIFRTEKLSISDFTLAWLHKSCCCCCHPKTAFPLVVVVTNNVR